MGMKIGKGEVYIRDFDTYRLLVEKNAYDIMQEISDSFSEDAVVSMDENVLSFLELKARTYEEEIIVNGYSVSKISGCMALFRYLVKTHQDRDLLLIISGKTDMKLFKKCMSYVKKVKQDDVDIYVCILNRPEQEKYRVTIGIY